MQSTEQKIERAALAGLAAASMDERERSTDISLAELAALVETAGGQPVVTLLQNKPTPDPRTFLGEGKVAELKELILANDCDLAVFDNELSPSQMRVLEEELGVRVYPVGRLDKDSEGLLLMTNDGAFANLIAHPSTHVPKVYRVTVRPGVNEEQLTRLSVGVEIDGRMTLPATIRVLDQQPGRVVLEFVIHEGRNRQIRNMCEAVGLEVARLKRTAIGPVKLGMLPQGRFRELTPDEVRRLRAAAQKKGKQTEQTEGNKYAADHSHGGQGQRRGDQPRNRGRRR